MLPLLFVHTLTQPTLMHTRGCGYIRFGSTIGTLNVNACNATSCTTVWTKSGQQHSTSSASWAFALIPLSSGTINVSWSGVRGALMTGDIAIDTIRIGEGFSPTPQPTSSPTPVPPVQSITCDFNERDPGSNRLNWCNFAYTNNWQLRQNSYYYWFSGPNSGQGGSYDYFAQLNSGVTTPSTLTTPRIDLPLGGTLTFYYYMYVCDFLFSKVQGTVLSFFVFFFFVLSFSFNRITVHFVLGMYPPER